LTASLFETSEASRRPDEKGKARSMEAIAGPALQVFNGEDVKHSLQ
jgi:hypothetical protein